MRLSRCFRRFIIFGLVSLLILLIIILIQRYPEEDLLFLTPCPNWTRSNLVTASIYSANTSSVYFEQCHEYIYLRALANRNGATVHRYCKSQFLLEPRLYTTNTFLLVGVLSSPHARDLRDAVRETWGSPSLLARLNRCVHFQILNYILTTVVKFSLLLEP